MNYFVRYRLCLIAFGVLLLALFLFTTLFFHNMDEQIETLTDRVIADAQQNDKQAAGASLKALREVFDDKKWTLKLLLDHEEIDKLEIQLKRAERAVLLGQLDEAMYALDELRAIAHYIGQIELPLITNIF